MGHQDIKNYAQSLDRSFFIDTRYKACAYLNEPLPIGYGQTISQPSLVVEMTQLLCPGSDKSVLEIGTGSGFQTAILARFSKSVYTVECIAELSNTARRKLDALGFTNIFYLIGDGSLGWSDHAPYDRIIVTAAAGTMPEELVYQLRDGGIMIIPVGPRDMQELTMVIKGSDGMADYDPKWTAEALYNILDSAVKYSPPDSIIEIKPIPYEMFYRIDIADRGIGIAEEELGMIFARFYRSPSVAEREGVGIGLYLAREIIQNGGGYIKVSSTPGQGSVFSVFLSTEK